MLKETIVGEDLHEGRKIGYEVLVDKIIELYPTLIGSINSKGDIPLHLAATLGHTNLLLKMLNYKKSHNACKTETSDLSKVAELMNKDGSTPLHCAAMKGQVEIMREFLDKAPSLVTLEKKEPVFHKAVRHKNANAFIFMAKSANLGQFLYQLDVEGNTVLHVAASVGSLPHT
uniref:Alpha-latroinsectotoxin-Lt1a n=1 Tax=Noccaea caerulescens TaxID=107243 RepID=A0A1J3II38_NOCCA